MFRVKVDVCGGGARVMRVYNCQGFTIVRREGLASDVEGAGGIGGGK